MIGDYKVIGLGYNCEISFRLEDFLGKLDSYIFSWSYEKDRNLLKDAINNIEDVFTDEIILEDDHMFSCEKYKVKFHPRYEILPKFGEFTEKQYQAALSELRDRIGHLKKKTTDVFSGNDEIRFIVKIADEGENDNIEYLMGLLESLHTVIKSDKFVLYAVFERRAVTKNIKKLEGQFLKIRTLKKFAPVKHTDIMGDVRGWKKILCEVYGIKSKVYYKNLWIRRKNLVPAMIKHKLFKN